MERDDSSCYLRVFGQQVRVRVVDIPQLFHHLVLLLLLHTVLGVDAVAQIPAQDLQRLPAGRQTGNALKRRTRAEKGQAAENTVTGSIRSKPDASAACVWWFYRLCKVAVWKKNTTTNIFCNVAVKLSRHPSNAFDSNFATPGRPGQAVCVTWIMMSTYSRSSSTQR